MKPVLLLHGALGAKEQLYPIKEVLTAQGRKVLTLNFSGHGGRPYAPSGFGIETFANDVLEFLEENRLDDADIFGYSMGGYVALWFALQHPERVGKIVTLGTKFDWDMQSAEKEVAKMDPEKIVAKLPAFARILESRHRPNDWKELMRKTAQMMLGLGRRPLLTDELLSSITSPVEIVLGELDDMADRPFSQKVAHILAAGSFELLAGTPHPIEKVRWIPFAQK